MMRMSLQSGRIGCPAWRCDLSADGDASKLRHRRTGVVGPGSDRGGEGEDTAVEDVLAALADDEPVEGAEGSSLAGESEDVAGRAFAEPVPFGEANAPGKPGRRRRVIATEPVVE